MNAALAKYNIAPYQPAGADEHAAANGAVSTSAANVGTVNPDNPMLWLFGIGALTIGLIGVSTHVRVGTLRAGFDAGTP